MNRFDVKQRQQIKPYDRPECDFFPSELTPEQVERLPEFAALPSEQAALAEWQRLEKRMPEVLGGRKPGVAKFEHDGKTFWRLRTGGFADSAEAATFCDRVKSKGQACTVANS